jgi:hypothetical protein
MPGGEFTVCRARSFTPAGPPFHDRAKVIRWRSASTRRARRYWFLVSSSTQRYSPVLSAETLSVGRVQSCCRSFFWGGSASYFIAY